MKAQKQDEQHVKSNGLTPKLRLVKDESDDDYISELVGLSHPKEMTPTSSETIKQGKSPEHPKAIEDVGRLRAGEISRTELKSLYGPTYKNWDDMKQRCRGKPEEGVPPIPLDSLFNDFASFLSIMGPRPEPTWSLDRIDPTGAYAPGNLRWANKTTQSRNRRNTIYLTLGGVTRPLVEWAEIRGENPDTYYRRKRMGWSDEEIITGQRIRSVSSESNSHHSGDLHWQYTPWPAKFREDLERLYQRHGRTGEHRLLFMERYSQEWLTALIEEVEFCSWPDDYIPTEEEAKKLDHLTRQYNRWSEIFRDSRRKLDGEYRNWPYGKKELPAWVERNLAAYT